MTLNLTQIFHLSTHITLALASFTLATAEDEKLRLFYLAIGCSLLGVYFVVSRWRMPTWLANLSALVLATLWFVWLANDIQLERERLLSRGGRLDADEMVRLVLKGLGPLAAVLLVAKMFRPKRAADYWIMHVLGAVQIMLACTLATNNRADRDSALFVVFFLSYIVSMIWCMMTFSLQRDDTEVRASNARATEAFIAIRGPVTIPVLALWRTSVLPALRGLGGVAVLGFVIYFFMPPSMAGRGTYLLAAPNLANPVSNSGVNLTNASTIDGGSELVFRVEGRDHEGNKANISPTTRWRRFTCPDYDGRGRWTPSTKALTAIDFPISARPPELPKNLGDVRYKFTMELRPDDYRPSPEVSPLIFDAQREERAYLIMHNPVSWPPEQFPQRVLSRLIHTDLPRSQLRIRPLEQVFVASMVRPPRPEIVYYQTTTSATDGPLRGIELSMDDSSVSRFLFEKLREMPSEPEYAIVSETARRVMRENGLPETPQLLESRQQMEARARALERFLSTSPEFAYSLERPHLDPSRYPDPTLEFLSEPEPGQTAKRGRCDHFASALALMLRSQNIPCRVVVGFLGADYDPIYERYEVRRLHAHAWVEAFVGDRNLAGNIPLADVLMLEPTPGATARSTPDRGPLGLALAYIQYFWESYVLDDGAQRRQEAVATLLWILGLDEGGWMRQLPWPAIIGILSGSLLTLLAAAYAVYRWFLWRRSRVEQRGMVRSAIQFYNRLTSILEQVALLRKPTQTPLEFGALACETLRSHLPQGDKLVNVPNRVAECYYQVRFGTVALDQHQLQDLDRDLDELEAAIKQIEHTPRAMKGS